MSRKASRRTFLKLSAAAASLSAAEFAHAAPQPYRVEITLDPLSHLTNDESVQWAADRLHVALNAKGIMSSPGPRTISILVAPAGGSLAKLYPGLPDITQPETTAIIPFPPRTPRESPLIVVTGIDTRGLVYGLLELADRVRSSDDPILALHFAAPLIETTPNKVRSVARGFCSEIEDKPWFYDRAFWSNYLDTLVTARFNRFALTFGLAYDFPRGVTDDYLHLPYPYLVEVPGFEQVHVEPALQPGERQRNLETLQFIAAETARRGMDFQLGIWTHAYQWTDSPHSNHHIVGLTPETHAQYCHDALALILKACPQIKGITMRIHGESGIPEGSYPFWQKVFDAIPEARTPDGKPRKIEIDMHAKGLNQTMIDMAIKTGMPVKAGAKYWAEHLGLGYQQTDIRANEYPREGVTGTFAVSSGARNFTRYGYGDFYQQNSGIDLLYRVWPGTQRHLLWGDPALAAGYGRAANFCGAAGLEIMEPLFFKGREGSGQPGGRDAYADASLKTPSGGVVIPQRASAEESASPTKPSDLDTAKFTTTFMLWGRYLYNPNTDPSFYHRYLKQQFGPAGPALETALAASSRILPLVTTAWCPSASNHEFWPEMFTPQSILPVVGKPLYGDNPAPHNVSAISPLDPQLFTSINQHAADLISGTPNARYNTSEVIAWLNGLVQTAATSLTFADKTAGVRGSNTREFRRVRTDIEILIGLGSYFASLFRTALLYSIHRLQPDPRLADQCISAYRDTRKAWIATASRGLYAYTSDISYGSTPFRRGNWADRVPAVEADLAALEKHFAESTTQLSSAVTENQRVNVPIARPTITANHTAPQSFQPGSALPLTITTPTEVTAAILWYRHVNHGERWLSTPMQHSAATHKAAIPAAYTNSPYPLQYYFELRTATSATLHPPLNSTWSNQPYYAIHKRT